MSMPFPQIICQSLKKCCPIFCLWYPILFVLYDMPSNVPIGANLRIMYQANGAPPGIEKCLPNGIEQVKV
jgi:hypothetical protein